MYLPAPIFERSPALPKKRLYIRNFWASGISTKKVADDLLNWLLLGRRMREGTRIVFFTTPSRYLGRLLTFWAKAVLDNDDMGKWYGVKQAL